MISPDIAAFGQVFGPDGAFLGKLDAPSLLHIRCMVREGNAASAVLTNGEVDVSVAMTHDRERLEGAVRRLASAQGAVATIIVGPGGCRLVACESPDEFSARHTAKRVGPDMNVLQRLKKRHHAGRPRGAPRVARRQAFLAGAAPLFWPKYQL